VAPPVCHWLESASRSNEGSGQNFGKTTGHSFGKLQRFKAVVVFRSALFMPADAYLIRTCADALAVVVPMGFLE
jgi:hypothetical protein